MPDPSAGPPPDDETFEYAGCRVAVVDPADIVRAAESDRVELLRGAAFPAPVRQARLSVRSEMRDAQRVYLLDAEVHTSAGDPPGGPILGNDPLAVLLSWRLAAGDPWAARIVDGVGAATAEAYRLLGKVRPGTAVDDPATAGPAVLEDAATGLRVTVTHTRGVTALRAAVPAPQMRPAMLSAMFRMVLQVVLGHLGEALGAEPLAGRSYVLSQYPAAGSTEPDADDVVDLDQVGGLPAVVSQFREIAVSFRHPQVMARWGARRPQGILMYGPPGTGKTMLARALANEIGARFREIRTPEIIDKWLGGSERNIKRIFRDARRYREPTVMLFDEFDSIISYTGGGDDAASQALNAVAGIFKQEMNNLIEANPNVMVIATTNFPDRVDESLIRSGRFDIKIKIPLPDAEGRAEILAKMIRRLRGRHDSDQFQMFADDLDVRGLAQGSEGMTGADIKEALRRVQLAKAMQEARGGAGAPPISQDDLRRSLADVRRTGAAA